MANPNMQAIASPTTQNQSEGLTGNPCIKVGYSYAYQHPPQGSLITMPRKRSSRKAKSTLTLPPRPRTPLSLSLVPAQQKEMTNRPTTNSTLLSLPQEIKQYILEFLHPIDVTCLCLTHKLFYALPSRIPNIRLTTGSPYDSFPHPNINNTNSNLTTKSCKHCIPVLYYPSHCQLFFHLRSWFPKDLKFCGCCSKFTRRGEGGVGGGGNGFCGRCGTAYWRMFERGRRMLPAFGDTVGEMETEGWVRKRGWYNEPLRDDVDHDDEA